VQALARSGREIGHRFEILEAVMMINDDQKTVLFNPIREYFRSNLRGVRIAMWGLAFKPETDDIREAPALYMIEKLTNEGAVIVAYDPEAIDNVKRLLGHRIEYADGPYEALDNADALLICTEWAQFRNPDFEQMGDRLNNKAIFDGRNLYDLSKMRELGFFYKSVGREVVNEEREEPADKGHAKA
jgi:UDPglucose 6-dehydrogenase